MLKNEVINIQNPGKMVFLHLPPLNRTINQGKLLQKGSKS